MRAPLHTRQAITGPEPHVSIALDPARGGMTRAGGHDGLFAPRYRQLRTAAVAG